MEVRPRAKINPTLRVLGKREDGYHELETLMVQVDLADSLDLEPATSGTTLECDGLELAAEDNLVVKAARLLEAETGRALPVRARLRKRIPWGAGLGGGSSDAASMLLAMNQMFSLALPQERLLAMASALGSDVPFFILNQPCVARGRGEILQAAPNVPSWPIAIFKPPFEIPTPWAYRNWSTAQPVPGFRYEAQVSALGEFVNDLERPVFAKYLILGQMKSWLLDQPEVAVALLSGSGSAMFAIPRDPDLLPALIARAKERYGPSLWTHIGRTVGAG